MDGVRLMSSVATRCHPKDPRDAYEAQEADPDAVCRYGCGLTTRGVLLNRRSLKSRPAILQRGGNIRLDTLTKIKEALEEAGIEFIPENGGGAGVRLAKRGKRQK
jgi:hypothetical protein